MMACIVAATIARPASIQAPAKPQVHHYKLLKGAQEVGAADYTFAPLKEGGYRLVVSLQIGQQIKIKLVSDYDGSYVWKKKTMDIREGDQAAEGVANLTADGADVDAPGPNGRFKHVLQPPAKESLADPTMGWWRTTKPTVGTSVEFAYFNLQNQMWEQNTVTYVGDEDVSANQKTVHAHHLVQKTGDEKTDLYVGDDGYPVVIDGNLRYELTSISSEDSQ